MDVGLGWLGVIVGLAGCMATYAMSGGPRVEVADEGVITKRTRMAAGLTMILTIIVWAIAMQTRAPFSPGQRLGYGFALGGILGAAAINLSWMLGLRSMGDASERRKLLTSLSMAFYALLGASLTYSLFHDYPQPALIGFSIGAAMAAILGHYAQDSESAPGSHMEIWAIVAITIVAGTMLAVEHFDQTVQRNWWALPILMTTSVLVSSFIGAELIGVGKRILGFLIAPVLILGLSAIYSWRLIGDWALLGVAAVGIAIVAIVAWLASKLGQSDDNSGALDVGSVCVLLVVAFIVAAVKLWVGLGIAIGLLAGLSIAILASGAPARVLRSVLSLGLVILLFRLFIEVYRSDLGSEGLRVHYTFIGAMLGALLPFMFVSALARLKSRAAGDTRMILSVGLIGLISAATPLLLCLIWGMKAALGFLFGLPVALAFMLLAKLSADREQPIFGAYSIALLAIGAELAAIQFVGPLMGLELTRAIRIAILGGVVVIAAVWTALSARRAA